MALQQEIWVKEIEQILVRKNDFFKFATDDTASVINNAVVHLPQIGSAAAIREGAITAAGTAAKRTDTELTYNLSQIGTQPIVNVKLEDIEVSYNAIQATIDLNTKNLVEKIGDKVLYKWMGGATHGYTTGSARTAGLAKYGATGTRKAVVTADILAGMKKLDYDNVPRSDRYLVIDPEMYSDIQQFSTFQTNESLAAPINIDGAVGKIYGATVIVRAFVGATSGATGATFNAIDPGVSTLSVDTTAKSGALLFHKSAVRMALGTIDVFEVMNDPYWMANIVAFGTRYGASKSRTNGEGIYVITEG